MPLAPRLKYDLDRYDFPNLESRTDADGKRVYFVGEHNLPSVTTILSQYPDPGLLEWQERVGAEEAERIRNEAANIGSLVHNNLEEYVQKRPTSFPESEVGRIASNIFHAIHTFSLPKISEIWGIEEALYYESLYAGRTDLIGVYNGKPSIIDYKNSIWFKRADRLTKYKEQIAAYVMAFEDMFPGARIEQGVLLIGIRPNAVTRQPAQVQTIVLNRDDIEHWMREWIGVLDRYYTDCFG